MDKHNENLNKPEQNDLESTKKFNLDDFNWTPIYDTPTDKTSEASTSGRLRMSANLSGRSGTTDDSDPNELFNEIFDSQKKAADSFDDTFDDFSSFSTLAFSDVSNEESSDSHVQGSQAKSSFDSEKDSNQQKEKKDPDNKSYDKKTPAKKKKKFFRSNAWFVIRTILLIFLCTAFICTTTLIVYMFSLDDEVNIEVEALRLNYSSIVYYVDEDGVEHEYERLYDSQNRTWVNLEDIPKHLQNAAIAIEDHRFREHNGVDWKRTLSACFNMFFKTKSDFGASTITQQLVKNLTGDNQDSVKRKLQEIMRAQYLEDHYDKDTILELYLNTIFLGEGCYGVGTAAHTYFGKDVSELTIAESAAIIGITNLPTYKTRCHNIINRMYAL